MKKDDNFQTQPGSTFNSPKFHMNEVLAKFSPALTRNEQRKLITQEVISILGDPNWFIRENYHDQQWKQLFFYIQESYCRRFFLMQTGVSNIVQQIAKIKFACLKQIDLSNNNITSIQIISFLKIPQIKNIVLKNNHIVNISPLRRGKWKFIELIDIQGNFVIQWKRITELQITQVQIETFSIEYLNSQHTEDLQQISNLYAKLDWNLKTEQIQSKIDLFTGLGKNLETNRNLSLIRLRNIKSNALKRKFFIRKDCQRQMSKFG